MYGGEIIGESQMKNLEDIGSRVTHKYQIDNNGNWDLNDLRISISWPIQVSPGEGVRGKPGKWLLYLESIPIVSGKLFVSVTKYFQLFCTFHIF